ncbi:MAG: Flagellar FliJ protein [Bacteroidota bacterium]|nr:Flagellar FliJ protein [Bacteroidota bacterium]
MAKKFVFALESVLKLRSHKVEEAKDSLNRILGLRLKKESDIADKEEYMKQLLQKKPASSGVKEMQAQWYHKIYVEDEIRVMEREKEQLIEIENVRRVELSEAMKEEKILLKLREKKEVQHQDEIKREETIFLDEIAGSRYIRNKE